MHNIYMYIKNIHFPPSNIETFDTHSQLLCEWILTEELKGKICNYFYIRSLIFNILKATTVFPSFY